MRKLILVLLFLSSFVTAASAQQEFANLELPMRRAEDLVTVADGDGNVCLYFFQGGKLYFNLVSPSGKTVASQEIPYRWNQQPDVLGTRVTENEFVFYSRFVNGRNEYVRPFAINRETGAFRSMPDVHLKKGKGEFFVGGFADTDHFYMLYSDKKSNLHLYREVDESYFEKKSFDTEKLPRTRDRYERQNELIFVHPDLERTVFAGHHRSKMYTRGDKIFMIFDGFSLKGQGRKATTEILTLDWNSGQTDYRTLPSIEVKNDLNFNSFLHQNTLFRVQLNKDQFNLTAYDFNSLQPVKEYNYKGDEEIAIKATPVHQRGARSLFSSENTVIEKTSKVMRNLSNGIPAITVDAFSDSTIQLTIGSYQPPKTRNSPDPTRLVRTPDRYVQTSRGLFMIPGRWVPAYSLPYSYNFYPYSRYVYDPFYSNSGNADSGPGISTYFRAVLDSETLTKAASDSTAATIQDKIEAYEDELKSVPDFKTVYRYGNKLHYGYFDKRSKKFKILEFAQK